MIVSAVGYLFSLIAILTTIMAFMTVLIGGFNPLTVEKVLTIRIRALPLNRKLHRPTRNLITHESRLEPMKRRLRRISQRRIRVQRIGAQPPPQKQTPRTASLNEKSSQRGLRIFTNPKSWHVSSRTMRDTAKGWL